MNFKYKLGDVVYQCNGAYLDTKPYIIAKRSYTDNQDGVWIQYGICAPGYADILHHNIYETTLFPSLEAARTSMPTKPKDLNEPGSTLAKKFRRRWVGGKYVEEPIP